MNDNQPRRVVRRYTLAEAATELKKGECHVDGHDFEIVVVYGGAPTAIFCARCSEAWEIRTGAEREQTA